MGVVGRDDLLVTSSGKMLLVGGKNEGDTTFSFMIQAIRLDKTCSRLAKDILKTCTRLAQDLHKTCIKLAKKLKSQVSILLSSLWIQNYS